MIKLIRIVGVTALLLACAGAAWADSVLDAKGSLDENDTQLPEGRYVDWYKVPLTAGTRYLFGVESDELDTALLLRFADGVVLANDDFAGSNPGIAFAAVRTETVEVGVANSTDPESGSYALAVEKIPAGRAVQAGQKVARATGPETADGRGWRTDSLMLIGGKGDRVTVRVKSAEFDPILRFQTRAGFSDERHDEAGGNAAALSYVFLQQGQVEIVVRAVDPTDGGKYELEVERLAAARVLQVSSSLEGKLGQGADLHILEGRRGQAVSVAVESDEFDPVVEVVDRLGRRAANDDWQEQGSTARVVHVFTDDQPVSVAVTRVEGGEAGAYRLTVEPVELDDAVEESIDLAELEDGVAVNSYLPATAFVRKKHYVHRYTFQGEPQQVARLELQSKDMDALLEVIAPDGTVTSDDDGLRDFDALVQLLCNDQGTYVVRVTTSGDWQTGAYRLSFEIKGTGEPLLETEGRLERRDPRDLSGRHYDTHTFVVEKGSFAVSMTSDELDSYLYVWDPEGKEILSDDDGGGGSNAQVKVTDAAPGTWTVYATTLNGAQTGAYSLRVVGY